MQNNKILRIKSIYHVPYPENNSAMIKGASSFKHITDQNAAIKGASIVEQKRREGMEALKGLSNMITGHE